MNKRDMRRGSTAEKTRKNDRNTDGDVVARRRFPAHLAGILLAVVAVVFLVYSMVSLIGIRTKLKGLRSDLADLTTEIANQERSNERMQAIANQSGDELNEYMEQLAHDRLDLVHEGEKIYIVVSGD